MTEDITPYSCIECSICGSNLIFQDNTLVCSKCASVYHVRNNMPDLLPFSLMAISKEIEKIGNRIEKFEVTPHEMRQAGKWLAKQIGIPENEIDWGCDNTFRYQLAYGIKKSADLKLGREGRLLLAGILGSRNMSFNYKSIIADQLSARGDASGYEAYEDILLRNVMDEAVTKNKVALIEIGSGVGRLLHQYGTSMTRKLSSSGYRYRRFGGHFYEYNENYQKNLRLLIGLDYENRMIEKSTGWLKRSGLSYLLERHRIIQIRGLATKLKIGIDPDLRRVVTILFQTLGNQLGTSLQIAMLKKAKEFAGPDGIVFVSVFNKDAFNEQAEAYYNNIRSSVGKIAYCKNGVFLSDRGVFSLWFDEQGLKRLFNEAGMYEVELSSGNDLCIYPEYSGYLSIADQEKYKKRAIIAKAIINER